MAVGPSPFKVTPPDDLGTDRVDVGRLWRVVSMCAAFIRAFVSGRVLEWHYDEPIDASGLTTILHNLGRKPTGYIIFRTDTNAVPYTNYEAWTADYVVPKTAAGAMRISFVLFVLAAALALPASATCVYGYAQLEPVRFWVCLSADTTTGAREGDTRYDTDTGKFKTYDGAVWSDVGGGGGGAPTTATYLTQTPDATLSAEQAMSTLATGITLNTTGTGVQSIYAGSACGANTVARSANASGALTCSAVADADITAVATTKLTGTVTDAQLASNYSGIGTCTNQFTRVLNDNAAPTCASVALGSDVSGTLQTARGGTANSTAPDDNVMVGDGADWLVKTVPDCTDTAGSHLNYTQSTNTFSCGTSSSTSASTLLDTLGAVQGSVLYRGASAWTVLAPTSSSAGLVLKSSGPSSDPVWSTSPRVLPSRLGLVRPPCNAVRRRLWRQVNCT